MAYNLLDERWIPVRRRSGAREWIRPPDIVDRYDDDPIVDISSPRPDFDGALLEFLIGLLQTTFAPPKERVWSRRLTKPPAPSELATAMEPYRAAFELRDAPYPFMQEPGLSEEPRPISMLLIDAPADNTIQLNKDHFTKRGAVPSLCPACAASALLTLQTYAPGGGQGHRTSLRGGGPLTTLVSGETAWESVWLNIAAPARGREEGPGRPAGGSRVFPWLAETALESRVGKDTSFADVDPLQVHFGMPRRLLLHWEGAAECGLCRRPAEPTASSFSMRSWGVNYIGTWNHPLSPHYEKGGQKIARKGQPGVLLFRNWPGLLVEDPEGETQPAAVVARHALRRKDGTIDAQKAARTSVRVFGFDMEKMKARGFTSGRIPLPAATAHASRRFLDIARSAVNVAERIEKATHDRLKAALFRRPKDKKGSPILGSLRRHSQRLWFETEGAFVELLAEIDAACLEEARSHEHLEPHLRAWLARLQSKAIELFDEASGWGTFQGKDPRRVAEGRRALRQQLYHRKNYEDLGLAAPNRNKRGQRT